MRLHGEYDPDNIFAKILRGEIPSAKVWEDDDTLVIMDAFPQTEGHCLILPKAPARNLMDAPADMVARIIQVTQRVAKAVAEALDSDGVRVAQFNGAPAGQSVFHLHFHVIPIKTGAAMGEHGGGQADPEALSALAAKIAAKMD